MNDSADTPPPVIPPSQKRCWLHVGMHKTGTTSIQSSLGAVRNHPQWRMLKVGGRTNMGKALCAMFSQNPSKHSVFRKQGKSNEAIAVEGKIFREKLRLVVSECNVPNIIISAEALSSEIHKDGLAALRDLLAPLCGDIRVIGYVRPPVAFKTSIFQEAVKHGKNKFNVAEVKVGYRRRFRKFDEVFGQANVLLRKFDPASFPGGCIVADFCEQTGLEPPPAEGIRRTNESLSREACGMLYAYRKFGPGYGVGDTVIRENNGLIVPLFGISGEKLQFSSTLMLSGLAEEMKDIRWMERRIGASLHEKFPGEACGISTEKEFLTVSRSCCVAYAREFEKRHGLPVPEDRIPVEDPVDPAKVAEFIEFCRHLVRVKASAEPPQTTSLFQKRYRRFLRWLNEKFAKSPKVLVGQNSARAKTAAPDRN